LRKRIIRIIINISTNIRITTTPKSAPTSTSLQNKPDFIEIIAAAAAAKE
jgi:hypothetical protein